MFSRNWIRCVCDLFDDRAQFLFRVYFFDCATTSPIQIHATHVHKMMWQKQKIERERTVLRGLWTSFKFNWHSVPNVFGFVVDGVFKLILYAVLWLCLWYRCALSILVHKNRTSNFQCVNRRRVCLNRICIYKNHSTKTMKMPFDKSAKTIRANVYVPKGEKIPFHTNQFNNLSPMKRFICLRRTQKTVALFFSLFSILLFTLDGNFYGSGPLL